MFGLYRFDDMGDWEKETLLACSPDEYLLEKEIDRIVEAHDLLLAMSREVMAVAESLPFIPIMNTNVHSLDIGAAIDQVQARHPDLNVDWGKTGHWHPDLDEDDFEIRELPMLRAGPDGK